MRKTELVGLLRSEHSNSLLEIDFRMFNDGSPKIKDNINMIVRLKMQQIHVTYVQQPVMRLIDFIMVQVVGVLTTPEYFNGVSSAPPKSTVGADEFILGNKV